MRMADKNKLRNKNIVFLIWKKPVQVRELTLEFVKFVVLVQKRTFFSFFVLVFSQGSETIWRSDTNPESGSTAPCTQLKERSTDLNMTPSLPADGALAEETADSFKLRQLAQPWKFFQPLHQLLLQKGIIMYTAAYSLQLWQLPQPWKLFQPLHQLLLQKGIIMYKAYSLQLWQLAQPWKLFQPLHQLLLKKE